MNLQPIEQWRPTPRVPLAAGTRVRFCGGGPIYRGSRFTLPGLFRVQAVYRSGSRVFLEVQGLDRVGGTYIVLVAGRSYRRFGVLWRPYKVRRA